MRNHLDFNLLTWSGITSDLLRLRSYLLPAALVACIVGSAAHAEMPGGSNFAWFDIAGCEENDFNALQKFTEARPQIEVALRTMYANGQRRLRLPIYFRRDAPIGAFKVGPDGLPPEDLERIRGMLGLVKRIGFDEVIVGFFPLGDSIQPLVGPLREGIYNEHWSLVRQVRPILADSGLHYWVDLMNEAIPLPSMTNWLSFTRRLWQDYTQAFGMLDTLGFSSVGEAPRMQTIRAVYGDVHPAFLDVHIYGSGQTLKAIHAELARQGLGSWPWIIGEMYYDNPAQLADLRAAADASGVEIRYILQWPNARGSGCPGASAVPLEAPESLIHPPQ